MIVKHAYRADTEHVCDVDSLFPTVGVNLAVFTTALLLIPQCAVSAVHFRSSMIGLALLWATTQARISLQSYQGTFVVRDGVLNIPVLSKATTSSPDFVRFRRGDGYAVWDKRGLSLRHKNWIFDSRLSGLPVSPKLFSKKEIQEILASVHRGERSLDATAMSGALRLGTDAFFVPRWIDKKGFTWLEALVRVDLSADHPKPELIGRLPGQSLASGSIDHRLFALGPSPAIVVRKGSEWGVVSYESVSDKFNFNSIGERLRSYAFLDGNGMAYVEVVADGLNRIGVVDVTTSSRKDLMEDRGSVRLLDSYRPICAIFTGGTGSTIRNLQTGAALDLPDGANAVRCASGILLTWPKDQPKHAVLLDPVRWDRLAQWQAPENSDLGSRISDLKKTDAKPPQVTPAPTVKVTTKATPTKKPATRKTKKL